MRLVLCPRRSRTRGEPCLQWLELSDDGRLGPCPRSRDHSELIELTFGRRTITVDPQQMVARLLQDTLSQSLSDYWRKRARTLEDARHQPVVDGVGGTAAWPGDPSPSVPGAARWSEDVLHELAEPAPIEDLRERWVALTQAALACRRHAALLEQDGIPDFIVNEIASVVVEEAA